MEFADIGAFKPPTAEDPVLMELVRRLAIYRWPCSQSISIQSLIVRSWHSMFTR